MTGVLDLKLSEDQEVIAGLGRTGKLFAEGTAGTGKTTAAVTRIARLLNSRVSGHEISVIVPQPLLAWPYRSLEGELRTVAGARLNITTYGSIARRAVELFWPVVNEALGHLIVRAAPVFLNTESAQFHLGRVIDPLIDQRRLFESVRLPRRRIYTQVLDNLNKSALVGFGVDEIGARLQSAWSGQDAQSRMFEDVQTCVSAFRAYCLEHGLLDYSLTVETFQRYVWPLDSCRVWLMQTARHVVYDNAEEDSPAAHDLLFDLVEASESALVLLDRDAGFRRFLGADEISARRLAAACEGELLLEAPIGPGADKESLISALGITFGRENGTSTATGDVLRDIEVHGFRYYPDMIDAVCDEVTRLTEEEGIDPDEIAIVTPYLSDALRFALFNRLERTGVPVRSLRPSRPLGGEPAARCMLLLAQLAHPSWAAPVKAQDIAQALSLAVRGLDPVRAYLLASTFRPASGLQEFAALSAGLRKRITEELGEKYEYLRAWIAKYAEDSEAPLDQFLARLYNEVLVREGFGYFQSYEAGNTAAVLVRSANAFRQLSDELGEPMDAAGYVQRVLEGLIGEQALSRPDDLTTGGVQVAPAYTFLMNNRSVRHQFWLDLGSSGWSERLQQPLGQPYVLSRQWPAGRRWTAADDLLADAEFGYRLMAGLLRRCAGRVWLTHVEYNEQGFTQQGTLMIALQRILRSRSAAGQGS